MKTPTSLSLTASQRGGIGLFLLFLLPILAAGGFIYHTLYLAEEPQERDVAGR
ncbi:MAG: hypothetical protein JJT75_05785 [Opitutales bacterium]|nr:hypothetical protein [Opitutales bacterium]